MIVWLASMPLALFVPELRENVAFILQVSLYANFEASFVGVTASIAERYRLHQESQKEQKGL